MIRTICSLLLISILIEPGVAQEDLCAAISEHCQQSGNMVVVGSESDARATLDVMQSAASQFEAMFGRQPPLTALVPGGRIAKTQREQLRAAGVAVQLPWMSDEDKLRLQKSAVRRQVEAQTADLPEAIRQRALATAMAAVSPADGGETHDGALAHELGHLWFIEMMPSNGGRKAQGHAYGGFAPDWLDETFAVLLENSTLRESRRRTFAELEPDSIWPLADFLTMTHPAAAAAKQLQATMQTDAVDSDSQIIILTADEADEFLAASGGDRATHFYAQVQVFSDFLIETSGGSAIFPSIASSLQAGLDFDDWLSVHGADFNLPKTLGALQRQWDAWLKG
ncbi:MAG: hypothetical protein AAGL69_17400 [Pseudomonadota bacterium]